MSDHQKLAALLLRLVAACWTVYVAFAWSMYVVEVLCGVGVRRYPAHAAISSVGLIALGVVVLWFSRPLGRLLARNLD